MKRKLWMSMVLVAWLAASPLIAKEAAPDVKADTKEAFATVADHVREQMAAGGRFEFLTADERTQVNNGLADMQSLFDRFGKVDAMDDKSKIQLYNDQSQVNALLTKRDGDREICTHEVPTGSKIPKTTCRNYAQMERERRDMLTMKDQMQHTMIPKSAITGKMTGP